MKNVRVRFDPLRRRGRVVRAPDFESGGHGFESRSDHVVGVELFLGRP